MSVDHEALRKMTLEEIKKIPIEVLISFDDEVFAEILTINQLNALSEEQVAVLAIKFYGST